jgi:hypothetical protein
MRRRQRRAENSLWSPRPSCKTMVLPLGRFQERLGQRRIRITPPLLVAALDVFLNDEVALHDLQVRVLAVA